MVKRIHTSPKSNDSLVQQQALYQVLLKRHSLWTDEWFIRSNFDILPPVRLLSRNLSQVGPSSVTLGATFDNLPVSAQFKKNLPVSAHLHYQVLKIPLILTPWNK